MRLPERLSPVRLPDPVSVAAIQVLSKVCFSEAWNPSALQETTVRRTQQRQTGMPLPSGRATWSLRISSPWRFRCF